TGYYAEDFEDLLRFSFISKNEELDRWEMHALMRNSLREHQRQHKYVQGNKFLFQYYSERLKNYQFTGEIEKPASDYDASFYHGLISVEKDPVMLEPFISWFREEDSKFFNYGRWEVSIPLHEQLIPYLEQKDTRVSKALLGMIVYDLAFIYFKQNKYLEAEKLFSYSVEIHESLFGSENRYTAKSYYGLATLYHNHNLEKHKDAERLYIKSLEIRKRVLGESHLGVALSANNLATFYQDSDRLDDAEPLYWKSIEICKLPGNYNDRQVAEAYINLVYFYHAKKEYSEAEKIGKEVVRLRKNALGMKHIDFAQSLNHLGNIYLRSNKHLKSLNSYTKALEIFSELLGESSLEIAKIYHNLGVLYYSLGDYKSANNYIDLSLGVKSDLFGEEHNRYIQTLEVKEQMTYKIEDIDLIFLDF
ncbi:tetratricopeptide repeat protein, partial [Peribacillus frigoritolerans]|uniref:tetratricopeptide repeat protein n=1 Tax=Peribacillus frigoritolerans TaxID=450367 RepID=UPI003637762E